MNIGILVVFCLCRRVRTLNLVVTKRLTDEFVVFLYFFLLMLFLHMTYVTDQFFPYIFLWHRALKINDHFPWWSPKKLVGTIDQSWGQFLFINSKFHSNSFLSIPESIPIPLVLGKVNSNSIPIPKKSIPYQFHPRMRLFIHIEQLHNNLI